MTTSRSKPSSKKSSKRRHPDVEIASIAVRGGFISSKTAKEVLREVKRRAKRGKQHRTSVIRVLLEQECLTREQCEELAREIERHTYICDACDRRCVLAPSSRRMLTCPRCSQPIEAIYTETSQRTRLVETARASEPQEQQDESDGLEALASSDRPVFGRYQIKKELGRGAMGVVYQARHIELKKDVALKVLLAGLGAKPSHINRFRREAAAVARLNHPNIVRVFDFGSDDDMYFLAMELVKGGHSLHAALKKKGQLELQQRLEILVKVCFAMQHAHEEGIVHRDLKPANILLTPDQEPLVADFGLAKDFEDEDDELTKPDARVGTPLFLAPECIHKGASAVDERADVWSLGVMLFLAVTGRYPFRSKTVMELYVQVLQERPDWSGARVNQLKSSQSEQATKRLQQPFAKCADRFPRDLKLICERALHKDPEQRFQTALDLGRELERYLNGETVKTKDTKTVMNRVKKAGAKKTPVAVISLVVLFVVSAISTVGLLMFGNGNSQNTELQAKIKVATDIAYGGNQAYTSAGFENSIKALEKLRGAGEGIAEWQFNMGRAHMALLQDAEAERFFLEAIQNPDATRLIVFRSQNRLAKLKIFQRDYSAARQWLVDESVGMVNLDRDRKSLQFQLVIAQFFHRVIDEKQFASAASAIEFAEKDGKLLYWSAVVDFLLRRYQQSLKKFKTSQSLGYESPMVRLGIQSSSMLTSRGARKKLADLRECREGLFSVAGEPRFYLTAGLACLERGQLETAARYFERGVLTDLFYLPCLIEYSSLLKAQDKISEALTQFCLTYLIDPSNKYIEDERDYLIRHAIAPQHLKLAQESLELERIWAASGQSAHLVSLAQALFAQGQDQAAFRILEEGAKLKMSAHGWFLYQSLAKIVGAGRKAAVLKECKKRLAKLKDYEQQRALNRLGELMLLRGDSGLAKDCALVADNLANDRKSNQRNNGQTQALLAAIEASEPSPNTNKFYKHLTDAQKMDGLSRYFLDFHPAFQAYKRDPKFVSIRDKVAMTDKEHYLNYWKRHASERQESHFGKENTKPRRRSKS